MCCIDTGFIFAAGLGKRLAVISKENPKPLVDFAGKKMIDWAIDAFLAHGIKKIIINLHYKADLIKLHLKNKYNNYSNIFISEEEVLFNTGGGLIHALPLIIKNYDYEELKKTSNYIFTANSDVVWKNKSVLTKMQEKFSLLKKNDINVDILMLFVPRRDLNVSAFQISQEGEVIMNDGFPYMFCGIQIIDLKVVLKYNEIINGKKSFSLGEIYLASRDQNGKLRNVYGLLCDDVYHVGTQEEFILFRDLKVLE